MPPARSPIRLALVALPLLLGACNEIIPKIELRDDYMGKRFLQPNRIPGEIERDAYGNPILPKGAEKKAP